MKNIFKATITYGAMAFVAAIAMKSGGDLYDKYAQKARRNKVKNMFRIERTNQDSE